jgi:CubicO group peptidase (beta-lactamase class C family)
MRRIFLATLTGILVLMTTSCEDQAEINIDVDSEILLEMQNLGIPSVVACIVKDKEIVWKGTYGFADAEKTRPATALTLYTLQSISKLFLGTSIMQLWENGLIDLEADINQYLPFEVRNPKYPETKITPYHLMTHTSGLAWPVDEDNIPDFHHFYPNDEEPLIRDWLPEYILPGGSSYRESVWKDFAPGEKWLYSNFGTSLLALVLETISNQDYRDYCYENILVPLEMENSGFRFGNLDPDLLARPFYDNGFPMHHNNLRHYPVANLKSNLDDFSHFITAFLNQGEFNGNSILEPETIEKFFEIQNQASGLALLWWNCLGDCIGHQGGGTGFKTRFDLYPERNKGIVIFSNIVNSSVYPGRIYELVRYQSTKY